MHLKAGKDLQFQTSFPWGCTVCDRHFGQMHALTMHSLNSIPHGTRLQAALEQCEHEVHCRLHPPIMQTLPWLSLSHTALGCVSCARAVVGQKGIKGFTPVGRCAEIL